MNIVTAFDDAVLTQYEERGSSAFFRIFFQDDGRCYPSESWMDFGAVILDWWILATIKLANGESPQELYFMDGPFCLRIEIANEHQTLKCSNVKEGICWVVELADFVSAITGAANKVIRYFSNLSMYEADCMSLQMGLDLLSKVRTPT